MTITGAPAPSGSAASEAPLLGTIVFYGDRTATTLGESRASFGIVSGDPAAAPRAASVKDAFRRMANVAAATSLESGFSIRGVNSEGLVPGAADAPLASFCIDGVQQTVNAVRRGSRSFFDADQPEVYPARNPPSRAARRWRARSICAPKTRNSDARARRC